jgi:hypothetical protein
MGPQDVNRASDFARAVSQPDQIPVEPKGDGYGTVSAIWTKMGSEQPSRFGWGSLGYWRASASIVLMFGLYFLVQALHVS